MKEFDELFKTFDTEGWLLFMEDVKKYKDSLCDGEMIVSQCYTSEDIAEIRGRVQSLNWVLNYKETIKHTSQSLKDDESY